MAAAALGIGAALCWGFADFLGGIRTKALTLALVLLVSQFTGLLAITIVVAAGQLDAPSFGEAAPAIGAGVAQLVGIAALYRALAIGTMSVISPISASGAAGNGASSSNGSNGSSIAKRAAAVGAAGIIGGALIGLSGRNGGDSVGKRLSKARKTITS